MSHTRILNETTYHAPHAPSGVTAIIGDAKQPDFHPRIKVSKWDNECNYSFGLLHEGGEHNIEEDVVTYHADGLRAMFYPHRAPVRRTPTELRWLNLEPLDPYAAAAEYELQRSLGHFEYSIATYRVTKPSIMLFGLAPADRYLELNEDITARCFTGGHSAVPVVRIPLANTNPYYMDAGLVNIDIHIGHQEVPFAKERWVESVIQVLGEYGVAAYRNKTDVKKGALKVYVDHDGRDVKVHSADLSFDILSSYLNFSCDYNKVYDYYSPEAWPDVASDIRDDHAYGLLDIHPELEPVQDEIIERLVRLFAEKTGVTVDERPYDKRENARFKQLADLNESFAYVSRADRSDPGWHYIEAFDGHEFEIWIDAPRKHNVVELSMRSKNVEFHYQPPLTPEQAAEGKVRWSHIEGSWAVYHADRKSVQGPTYRCAKVGHIYRPWAEDANGVRVWCELDIDAGNDRATITIPQDFLDAAEYPVLIDPTMGYQEVGASELTASVNTGYLGIQFNDSPYNGVINTINMFANITTNNETTLLWSFGVYSTSLALLCNTNEQSAPGLVGAQWHTVAPNSSANAIPYSTHYSGIWIGGTQGAYEAITLYYDTMANSGRTKALTYAVPWAATISALTSVADEFSVYLDIAAGGETPRNMGKGATHAW